MSTRIQIPMKPAAAPARSITPAPFGSLQRKCACGGSGSSGSSGGGCEACKKKKLQRRAAGAGPETAPPTVQDVLRSAGQPLDAKTRAFFEPRFGHDFSKVRIHADARAAESARAVNALAYTVGQHVVFGSAYSPTERGGKHLLAHELTHTLQQDTANLPQAKTAVEPEGGPLERNADVTADAVMAERPIPSVSRALPGVQRRAAPYIKKVTVHLSPDEKANLEWEGSPPAEATGKDEFPVSTGKGYSDPGDPPGTCTRTCCTDANTQCAPPWNRPDRVGACCTYSGTNFWTGTPLDVYNGYPWWTPIQPYYSSRGIALHSHRDVTGQPIGHGCVRMDEPNARRIHDYSNGQRTNVTIDGLAAPVLCADERKCSGTKSSGAQGQLEGSSSSAAAASNQQQAVPGLEGVYS